MRLFFFLLICLFPLSSYGQTAPQGVLTAGQVYKSCQVAEILGSDVRTLTPEESAHLGYCVGTVNAALYFLKADRALYGKRGYFRTCVPEGRTFAQIMFLVRYALEQKPEIHNEDAMKHVVAALQEAFPCRN